MNQVISEIEKEFLRSDFPHFSPGDTIRVHYKVKEGEKVRIQVYEGIVIAMRGSGTRATFTVRRVSYGIGIERIFPFTSKNIEKIEVKRRGKVRRAKLYYLRKLSGKKARVKERR